jgi:amino acid transporter
MKMFLWLIVSIAAALLVWLLRKLMNTPLNSQVDPKTLPQVDGLVSGQPGNSPPPAAAESPKVIDLDTTPTIPATVEGAASAAALPPAAEEASLGDRVKTLLIGRPRDLADKSIYHSLSLVAFLAWVGLGADGLSSSCYGPEEGFKNLIHPVHGDHTYLALFLALATIGTVLLISKCYSHIIEEFPSGGGGYLVASKMLGRPAGVVAGSALLVDYVLTITVSIAAAGEALFGLVPEWAEWKLTAEFVTIGLLIILNLRGVKESITVLLPVFMVFLVTHAVLILGSVFVHLDSTGEVASRVAGEMRKGWNTAGFGFVGMLLLFLRAYAFGAGTYTGIEAVSNSMAVMREPRVATGKRTMLYMAISLAVTAGGLVVGYLLLKIPHEAGKTMNFVLTEKFINDPRLGLGGSGLATAFLWLTILSEGALLVVASQAGFIGGPAALATMARDSWVPHWFGNLSERLATDRGVWLMGLSALAALLFTRGHVSDLVIMYSINVFVTFSLSMIGMCRHWWGERDNPLRRRRLIVFVSGAVLCLAILVVNIVAKFWVGGWRTIAVTGVCVGLCFLISRYYRTVVVKLRRLNEILGELPTTGKPNMAEPDPSQPTAAILVGGYGGLGIHTLLNSIKFAPGYYKNVVFLSVGVVDSGNFKGARAMDDLRNYTQDSLERFVDLARANGLPAKGFMAIGTDAVDELEHLCVAVAKMFPRATFFAGQLVFRKDTWYQRLLHNETAWSLQRRLQWAGLPMVILPTRVK